MSVLYRARALSWMAEIEFPEMDRALALDSPFTNHVIVYEWESGLALTKQHRRPATPLSIPGAGTSVRRAGHAAEVSASLARPAFVGVRLRPSPSPGTYGMSQSMDHGDYAATSTPPNWSWIARSAHASQQRA